MLQMLHRILGLMFLYTCFLGVGFFRMYVSCNLHTTQKFTQKGLGIKN